MYTLIFGLLCAICAAVHKASAYDPSEKIIFSRYLIYRLSECAAYFFGAVTLLTIIFYTLS